MSGHQVAAQERPLLSWGCGGQAEASVLRGSRRARAPVERGSWQAEASVLRGSRRARASVERGSRRAEASVLIADPHRRHLQGAPAPPPPQARRRPRLQVPRPLPCLRRPHGRGPRGKSIRGRAYHGPHERALELFDEMPRRGLAPDSFTYPYVVDACARLRMWRYGEELHCRVLKEGLDLVPAVGSSLLTFYVTGGSLRDARRVFDGFLVKSVGSSNWMMSEYIKVGDMNSARELFDAMVDRDVVSWNSMLAAYVKAVDIVTAKELFATMPVKNIVSWTTVLRALSDAGDFIGMWSLFHRMPERPGVLELHPLELHPAWEIPAGPSRFMAM